MRDIVKKRTENAEYKIINGERVRVARKKRRRNMSAYYVFTFFVVVVTMTVLSLTILFNASEVVVTGTDLYTEEQITKISGVAVGNNLIRLDPDTAEQCIMENLSYVEEVKVLRSFPDRISIKVTQAVPAANIEHEGKFYVVSETGKILEAHLDAPKSGLIIITGFGLTDTEVGDKMLSEDTLKEPILDTILKAVEDFEIKNIIEVNIEDRKNIKLNYDNRINILLGSSLDLDYKLSAIKVILEDKIEKTFNGVIYYHNESSGVSVIATDKLTGWLKNEAPKDYSIYEDEDDRPLQNIYDNDLV